MSTEVTTNLNLSRYEIYVDGELAGFADFEMEGAAAVFPHTEIAAKFGGRGLGTTLIREALDDVRARGTSVVPACSFVEDFLAKNPEYQDLIA
jgi:uncharacterized protein